MPLKNGQFYDVVFRVHTGSFARMPLERDDFFLRKQLAPVQADDTLLLPPLSRSFKSSSVISSRSKESITWENLTRSMSSGAGFSVFPCSATSVPFL